MKKSEFGQTLSKFLLLRPWSGKEIELLSANCRYIRLDSGQTLLSTLESKPGAFFLLSGMAVSYLNDSITDDDRLLPHFPGHCIGPGSPVLPMMKEGRCETMSECTALFASRDNLLRMCDTHPLMMKKMWALTTQMALLVARFATINSGRGSRSRIIIFILEYLKSVLQLTDEWNAIPWPISQTMFAECMGMSRSYLSGMLAKLRDEGVFEIRRGRLHVPPQSPLYELLRNEMKLLQMDSRKMPQ